MWMGVEVRRSWQMVDAQLFKQSACLLKVYTFSSAAIKPLSRLITRD
jgi:hypothetical protein